MRDLSASFGLALVLALNATVTLAKKEERVQIWQYQEEEPLEALSLDPNIQSVHWQEGDVEIKFIQAAPCGAWMPVNPVWRVERFTVVLNFTWHPQFPDTPKPIALCKKFVSAWVFRVPQGNYKVSFAASVPRFHQSEGKVFSLPGRK
jgi:hypothetical protein